MNRSAWLIGIFAITMVLIRPSYGQMAYGLSSVTYDPGSNAVDSISETELDYTAAYYYDPYVEGYLYDEANTDTPVASSASTSETWATCVPSSLAGPCLVAYVSLSAQATANHSYDIDSEHYVIAYYQYTEPDNTVVYQDPFNFSSSFDSAGGGGDYGGSFEDTPTYSTTVYVVSEYIYLGSTGAVASTVDASPWIDSISPAAFNPGMQSNVTITGGGFGQNPSLDFAPGDGLSYTIMSTTANTINLVLNVAATAAPGSRSVDVSSNGASGQGFLPGPGVSQRSNAKTISVNGSSCLYSIQPTVDTPSCNAITSDAYHLGKVAAWPHEDCTYHGSHIGLMMIPTARIYNQARYGFDAMRDGYSWIKNVQDGVNFFNGDKTAIAHQLESLWMKLNPQLPALTPAQIEQDIVVEYGDFPAIFSVSQQTITKGAYWVPDPNTNNMSWIENKQGNPGGTAYADFVFNHVQH